MKGSRRPPASYVKPADGSGAACGAAAAGAAGGGGTAVTGGGATAGGRCCSAVASGNAPMLITASTETPASSTSLRRGRDTRGTRRCLVSFMASTLIVLDLIE